jgi:hypothetical protein
MDPDPSFSMVNQKILFYIIICPLDFLTQLSDIPGEHSIFKKYVVK